VFLPLLLIFACEKKDQGKVDTGAAAALDRATFEQEEKGGQKLAIEGVDLADLNDKGVARYNKLIDSLVSPCGKAESLRKSATVSKNCKRSLYAARYIVILLVGGVEEEKIREFYADRYVNETQIYKFDTNPNVPHNGPTDAAVQVVEFYDYGCPVCVDTYPMVEEMLKKYPQDVVVWYKQNPITDRHPLSANAAQAALAAHKQGKFLEMHEKLFTGPIGHHDRETVFGYAKDLGLDMAKFEKDYETAPAQIKADDEEGNTAGVRGTPTLFFNGHKYDDPLVPELFFNWVEEELAVNR
jgi:protein-disulfide isomerase